MLVLVESGRGVLGLELVGYYWGEDSEVEHPDLLSRSV